MESKIANAVSLRYSPIAVLFSDSKPEGALQFAQGRHGCVAAMLISAAKGRTAAFDRQTFGCLGGGTGLGFGNQYTKFPGGIEYYLSTGNQEFARSEAAKNFHTSTPLDVGERYYKTPELAKKFIDSLPMTDVPTEYVLFKPLEQVDGNETPEDIVFLANPDQLSALIVLANYDREAGETETVIAPFAAGCHSVCILPFAQAKKEHPSAIIGMTDISARKYIDKDLLSFAVPYQMFLQMENNVEGSFLQGATWARVLERNQ
jgi:Uncharacterized protein conserved in archaea